MACSEVAAFLKPTGAHNISNISQQFIEFAARQIANNLSPVAKKF